MSYHTYKVSQIIQAQGYPFYSLIMAAMRQADTENLKRLQAAFPTVWEELRMRYNAPGGLMPDEATTVPRQT